MHEELHVAPSPIAPQGVQAASATVKASQSNGPTTIFGGFPCLQDSDGYITQNAGAGAEKFVGFLYDSHFTGSKSRDTRCSLVQQGLITMTLHPEDYSAIKVGMDIGFEPAVMRTVKLALHDTKTTIQMNKIKQFNPTPKTETLIGRVYQKFRRSKSIAVLLHSKEYHAGYTAPTPSGPTSFTPPLLGGGPPTAITNGDIANVLDPGNVSTYEGYLNTLTSDNLNIADAVIRGAQANLVVETTAREDNMFNLCKQIVAAYTNDTGTSYQTGISKSDKQAARAQLEAWDVGGKEIGKAIIERLNIIKSKTESLIAKICEERKSEYTDATAYAVGMTEILKPLLHICIRCTVEQTPDEAQRIFNDFINTPAAKPSFPIAYSNFDTARFNNKYNSSGDTITGGKTNRGYATAGQFDDDDDDDMDFVFTPASGAAPPASAAASAIRVKKVAPKRTHGSLKDMSSGASKKKRG